MPWWWDGPPVSLLRLPGGREQDKKNLKSKAKVRESTLPRSRACVVQWRTEARYPSLQLSMPDQIALAWNNDIEVIYCYADLLPLHGDKFGQVSNFHRHESMQHNLNYNFSHLSSDFTSFLQGGGLLPQPDNPSSQVSLLELQLILWLLGFTLLSVI